MLKAKKLVKRFGGLVAVNNVDILVDKNEIVSLIGPNGAGKTTVFNLISGVYRPNTGVIEFQGRNITGLKPHKICRLGIARTFQLTKPFLNMTAAQNVLVSALYGKSKSVSMADARQEALRWLEYVGIPEKRDILASNLSVAHRKLLEIARCLATEPKLILLDEVVSGLTPTETLVAMELIKSIWKDQGIRVLWIEHVMKAVMEISHRVIVLHHGEKIAEGPPKKITKDRKVIQVYLGESSNN